MEHYLVDFENVHSDELKKLGQLNDGDEIVLFYSEICKNLNLETLEVLGNGKVKVSCHKIVTGTKNALDFQLASYLGLLIGKSKPDDKFHIVTKDKGYDCLAKFWKNNGVSVKRLEPEQQNNALEKTTEKKSKSKSKKSKVDPANLATLEEVEQYLTEGDEPQAILEIVNKYKSRVAISNAISKKFKDSKRAGAIYQRLKPLLKAKNKS